MSCWIYWFAFYCLLFFFKQKTAYEMRISDWSSDVSSSDLVAGKRDIVCACGAKLVVDQRVKGVAVHPLVRKAPGRDALCRGECEPRRVGIVAGDKDDLIRAAFGLSGLAQPGHFRAGARDQEDR